MFSREVMMDHHLQYNHFPPLPPAATPLAFQAIEAFNEGDYARRIQFPNGSRSAQNLIEDWHLDFFLDQGDND